MKASDLPNDWQAIVFYDPPCKTGRRSVAFLLPKTIRVAPAWEGYAVNPRAGLATCGRKDSFCRKLGRAIAIGRALSANKMLPAPSVLAESCYSLEGADLQLKLGKAVPVLKRQAIEHGWLSPPRETPESGAAAEAPKERP